MNDNKAIARRINKELKARNWKQTDLLRKLIKYKEPGITDNDLYKEVNKKKGNFSTTLKGNTRAISLEDIYYISKIFRLPFEYIWLGYNKKEYFVPKGARYAAFQDNDDEYKAFIASLEDEDSITYKDEDGFNLFGYLGQFESINGYRFFLNNYGLHFDYKMYGQLMYFNSENHEQLCSYTGEKDDVSNNLIKTLAKHNDVKSFKAIYFDNCSLERFDYRHSRVCNKRLFGDDFLKTLLENEDFLKTAMVVREININLFDNNYDLRDKRSYIEPMFYEALNYALKNEKDYKDQLVKMLNFALGYSKSQYSFVNEYLKSHEEEYGDVSIDEFAPRFLRSSRYVPMGNIFIFNDSSPDKEINDLLSEIKRCSFNMRHIKKQQEKSNEEIKELTPDNPLFREMFENANNKNISYLPTIILSDKEFTYYQYYECTKVDYENIEQLAFIIDCLNKVQSLVTPRPNKVLVHGNINDNTLMVDKGKMIGLAGWKNCHYGNKYEDRAALLSNVYVYTSSDKWMEYYKEIFDTISKGFNRDEQITLIDKTLDLMAEQRKAIIAKGMDKIYKITHEKEKASNLELLKELYFAK